MWSSIPKFVISLQHELHSLSLSIGAQSPVSSASRFCTVDHCQNTVDSAHRAVCGRYTVWRRGVCRPQFICVFSLVYLIKLSRQLELSPNVEYAPSESDAQNSHSKPTDEDGENDTYAGRVRQAVIDNLIVCCLMVSLVLVTDSSYCRSMCATCIYPFVCHRLLQRCIYL